MDNPETKEETPPAEEEKQEAPSLADEAKANAEAEAKRKQEAYEARIREDARKEKLLAGKSLTTGEIAPLVPTDYQSMVEMASIIAESGLLPKSLADQDNPKAAAFAAIQLGLEVGIPPMQAVQNIAVINGKPCIYGDGQISIVKNSGKLEYIREYYEGEEYEDSYKAVCVTRRKGDPEDRVSEFSVADAKKAKLWTDEERVTRYKKGGAGTYEVDNTSPWFKYPKRMLMYRARSFNLRDNFADCLLGLQHSAEEMIDTMRDITPPEPEEAEDQLDAFEKQNEDIIIDAEVLNDTIDNNMDA